MIKNTVHASAWTSLTPAPAQYRWLDEDTACEVAVVGGGIAAAMIAMRFAEAGIDTVLLSDSPLGYGSTAVSSGIMTLSGEETLTCLAEKIGPERAMTAAHLLAEALDNVENLCGSFQNGCGFRRMDSLRYATESEGSAVLRREYSLRLHNGMDVELLDADTASEQFTFPMSAGVYTKNTAAQVDPYRMVHGLAGLAVGKGARIFENTGAETIEQTEEGTVLVECSTGHTVTAGYVVMATGARCQPPLRRPRRCAHHLYGAHRAGGRVCRMAGPLRHPSGGGAPPLPERHGGQPDPHRGSRQRLHG